MADLQPFPIWKFQMHPTVAVLQLSFASIGKSSHFPSMSRKKAFFLPSLGLYLAISLRGGLRGGLDQCWQNSQTYHLVSMSSYPSLQGKEKFEPGFRSGQNWLAIVGYEPTPPKRHTITHTLRHTLRRTTRHLRSGCVYFWEHRRYCFSVALPRALSPPTAPALPLSEPSSTRPISLQMGRRARWKLFPKSLQRSRGQRPTAIARRTDIRWWFWISTKTGSWPNCSFQTAKHSERSWILRWCHRIRPTVWRRTRPGPELTRSLLSTKFQRKMRHSFWQSIILQELCLDASRSK